MDYKYYSRRKRDRDQNEARQKRIDQQRLKYNLLGMLVMMIILLLALDMFNIGDILRHLFSGS